MGGRDGAAEAEAEGHVGSQDTWGYGSEHGSEYWDGGYYESDDDYLQAYDGDG